MANTAIPLGQHATLTVTPYLIDADGKRTARQPGDTARPDLWIAHTRVRISDAQVVLLRAQGKSKAAATSALHEKIAAEVPQRMVDAQKRPRARSGQTTVAQWLAVWIEREALLSASGQGLSEGSITRYRQAIRAHSATEPIGSRPLARVTTREIEQLIESKTTAVSKAVQSVLRRAFKAAKRDGLIVTSPASAIDPDRAPRVPEARVNLSDESGDALLSALRHDPAAHESDIVDVIRFVAGTGVRTSEALALAWDDVDLATGIVTIAATVTSTGRRQPHTKTASSMRQLTLPADIVGMLQSRLTARIDPITPMTVGGVVYPSLVFPAARLGSGSARVHEVPRWPSNFTGQVRRVFDRLGYPGITSKSFRRLVITHLYAMGMSPRQGADQMGHSKPSISMDLYQNRMGAGPTEAAQLLARP